MSSHRYELQIDLNQVPLLLGHIDSPVAAREPMPMEAVHDVHQHWAVVVQYRTC